MSSPTDAPGPPPDRPLEGVLVADLSRVLAGPYCTMLLADLGATVIKVESPAGDETRAWSPPEHDGMSTYYRSINRNKRSIVLDFGVPDDVALARRLVDRADVCVENFKVGGLARFGLDYRTVSATNPGLVYLSISGFGSGGGAQLPGYDLVVQAVSGMIHLTGDPGGSGYRAGVAVIDVITGLHGLAGVLAALHQRQRTGGGQLVEVNLLSSALSGLVNQSGAAAIAGVEPRRMGNAHPSVYPYEVFPTADRDVVIAAANDRQFRALCEVLGVAELADDVRFVANTDRVNHRHELRAALLPALAGWAADDLFAALNVAGVPAGPINTVSQGLALAASLGLDPLVSTGNAGHTATSVRHPIRFHGSSIATELAPPSLGEHSASIREWLSQGD